MRSLFFWFVHGVLWINESGGWRCRPWGFRSDHGNRFKFIHARSSSCNVPIWVPLLFIDREKVQFWCSTRAYLSRGSIAFKTSTRHRLDSMVDWLWWFGMGSRSIISGKLIAELIKQKARYRMSGWRSLSTIKWIPGARTRWLLSAEAGIRRNWRPREKVGNTRTDEKDMLESIVWVGKKVARAKFRH